MQTPVVGTQPYFQIEQSPLLPLDTCKAEKTRINWFVHQWLTRARKSRAEKSASFGACHYEIWAAIDADRRSQPLDTGVSTEGHNKVRRALKASVLASRPQGPLRQWLSIPLCGSHRAHRTHSSPPRAQSRSRAPFGPILPARGHIPIGVPRQIYQPDARALEL